VLQAVHITNLVQRTLRHQEQSLDFRSFTIAGDQTESSLFAYYRLQVLLLLQTLITSLQGVQDSRCVASKHCLNRGHQTLKLAAAETSLARQNS
jgi:hypothetical protein